MKNVKPVYIKALVVAIAVYIIGMTFTVSVLCHKVGEMDHALMHVTSGYNPHK